MHKKCSRCIKLCKIPISYGKLLNRDFIIIYLLLLSFFNVYILEMYASLMRYASRTFSSFCCCCLLFYSGVPLIIKRKAGNFFSMPAASLIKKRGEERSSIIKVMTMPAVMNFHFHISSCFISNGYRTYIFFLFSLIEISFLS